MTKNKFLSFLIIISLLSGLLGGTTLFWPKANAYEQQTINEVYGKPPTIELNLPTGWERRSQPEYGQNGYARGMFEYNSTHIFVDYYSKKKIAENLAKSKPEALEKKSYYILSEYGHNASSDDQTNKIELKGRTVSTAQYIYVPSLKQICTNDKVVSVGNDWYELRYNSYYYYFSATSNQNVIISSDIVNESLANYNKNYQTPISSSYKTCWDKNINEQQLAQQKTFGTQEKIDFLINNEQFGNAIIQFKVCTSISNQDFNANVDSDALTQIRNLVKTLNDKPKQGQTTDQIIGQVDNDQPCLKFFTSNALPKSQEEIDDCHIQTDGEPVKTLLTPNELRPMIKNQYNSKTFDAGFGKTNFHHGIIDKMDDNAILCLFDPPDETNIKKLKKNEDAHQKWQQERDGGFWGINNAGYIFADGWHNVTNQDYGGMADNALGFVPVVGDIYDGYRAVSGNSLAGTVSCSDRVISGAFTAISVAATVASGGTASLATRLGRVAVREIIENTGEKLIKNLVKANIKELVEKTIQKPIQNAITGAIVGGGLNLLLSGIIAPDKPKNQKPKPSSISEQTVGTEVYDQTGDYVQTKLTPYYSEVQAIDNNIGELEVATRLIKNPDDKGLISKLEDLIFIKAWAGSALYKKTKDGLVLIIKNIKKLDPKSIYVHGVNKNYTIKTDKLGRPDTITASKLELDPTPRASISNKTPGKLETDHAGHLIADMFGGTKNYANLVSMNGKLNLKEFKDMEMIWKKALQEGKRVDVKMKVEYDGDGLRPVRFLVDYTIKGEKPIKETFVNN